MGSEMCIRDRVRSPSSRMSFGKAQRGPGGQLATFVLADRCILLLHPQHRMWDPGGSTLIADHLRSWKNGETSEIMRGRGGQLATFVLAHRCILLLHPQHRMWDPGGSTLVVNQHVNWKNGETTSDMPGTCAICTNINLSLIHI